MAVTTIQQPPLRTQVLMLQMPKTPLSRDWEEWLRSIYLHIADIEARLLAAGIP